MAAIVGLGDLCKAWPEVLKNASTALGRRRGGLGSRALARKS